MFIRHTLFLSLTVCAGSLFAAADEDSERLGKKMLQRFEDGLPLSVAIVNGNTPQVRELIKQGCKPDSTSIFEALVASRNAVLKELMNYARSLGEAERNEFLEERVNGATPLLTVVSKNNPGAAKILCRGGANVNAAIIDQAKGVAVTPLHLAAKHNSVSMIKCLLAKKASPDGCEDYSTTPLHLAVMMKHGAAALALIKGGASVGLADKNGSTPLHMAVQNGMIDVVRELLAKGAKVLVTDKHGCPPFLLTDDQAMQVMLADAMRKQEPAGQAGLFLGDLGAALWAQMSLGDQQEAMELEQQEQEARQESCRFQ